MRTKNSRQNSVVDNGHIQEATGRTPSPSGSSELDFADNVRGSSPDSRYDGRNSCASTDAFSNKESPRGRRQFRSRSSRSSGQSSGQSTARSSLSRKRPRIIDSLEEAIRSIASRIGGEEQEQDYRPNKRAKRRIFDDASKHTTTVTPTLSLNLSPPRLHPSQLGKDNGAKNNPGRRPRLKMKPLVMRDTCTIN